MTPPRRRHLLDPADLRPRTRAESAALTRVQQWVLSTLVASLILHLAGGLVVAAYLLDEDRLDARIGLVVIAGILGFLAVVAALVIHRHKQPTWWLLAGVVPGLVAAWVVFG
jgi:hypothetical protein